MDDTYLKTIFWAIVVLYTLAVIGIWENFVQPLWSFGVIYLSPFFASTFQLLNSSPK